MGWAELCPAGALWAAEGHQRDMQEAVGAHGTAQGGPSLDTSGARVALHWTLWKHKWPFTGHFVSTGGSSLDILGAQVALH